MSDDFWTDRRVSVTHGDGWGFVIESNPDEEDIIRVSQWHESGESKETTATIENIWPESARKIATALLELANEMKPLTIPGAKDNEDFQKGFYAGLAYSGWGDEATSAAYKAAKSLG